VSGKVITIVVPVFNEADAIGPFLSSVFDAGIDSSIELEVLFVDDGSIDRTVEAINVGIDAGRPVRLISLSRNFGKEAALTAGLDHATGDAVVPMDVDLQDPVELLPLFVAKWREGYDVVQARRSARPDDNMLKRVTASAFYKLFNRLSATPISENVGDYRLMDRRVVQALSEYREVNRFMKGLFASAGFRTATIDYVRPRRLHGTTKWSFSRLWSFALDGLLSFSSVPLKIWTYLGVAFAAVSLLYGVFIAMRAILGVADVPGYSSLMTAVLFMGGIQLISLGVIGEYIGRIFLEIKHRPIYIIKDRKNVPEKASAPRWT
jgi:glycosyltransferase involved in cell wall biosynthesis